MVRPEKKSFERGGCTHSNFFSGVCVCEDLGRMQENSRKRGVPAIITHLMRTQGLLGRWTGSPRVCRHRPPQGGPLGSVPGVGSQGSAPRASSQSS